MSSNMENGTEALVLTDSDGNVYAIPRPTVEQFKLTPEQRAALEAEMGDDVAGFGMESAYMIEKLAGYRQADLINEANQARRAHEFDSHPDHERGGNPTGGVQNVIVGVWRSLSFMRPASQP